MELAAHLKLCILLYKSLLSLSDHILQLQQHLFLLHELHLGISYVNMTSL